MLCRAGLHDRCCVSYRSLTFISCAKTWCTDNSFTSTIPSNSSSCFLVILIFTSVVVLGSVLAVVVAAGEEEVKTLPCPASPLSAMLAGDPQSSPSHCVEDSAWWCRKQFPIFLNFPFLFLSLQFCFLSFLCGGESKVLDTERWGNK